jgi:integrase
MSLRAKRSNLQPDRLIALLAEHAAPHYKGHLAVMYSAGPRESSILHHCKVCDYDTSPGHEQIVFHDTKNNDDVAAAMHPWSVKLMGEYLEWRGGLHDREAPLFLTDRRMPYGEEPGKGGSSRHAFRGMVTRAGRALRRYALMEAAYLRRQGRNADARARWLAARADLELLAQLTPHWFRHRLATWLLTKGDLRAGMEQGGWRDVRSIMGYSHDVPQHRRNLVAPDRCRNLIANMDEPTIPKARAEL